MVYQMILSIIFTILAIVTQVQGCYTLIEHKNRGILWTTGVLKPVLLQPGRHLFNPINKRIQHIQITPNEDIKKDIQFWSAEGVPVIIDVRVSNFIDENSVVAVVAKYTESYDEKLVLNPIPQFFREQGAQLSVDDFQIKNFAQMDDLLKTYLQRLVDPHGITIEWTRIENIRVPESIRFKRVQLVEAKNDRIMAEEKNNFLKVEEERLRIKQEAEHQREKDTQTHELSKALAKQEHTLILAEKKQEADNKLELSKAKARAEKSDIENEENLKKAKANAEAKELDARAEGLLYKEVPGLIDLRIAEAMSKNERVYYGDKLPEHYPILQHFAHR